MQAPRFNFVVEPLRGFTPLQIHAVEFIQVELHLQSSSVVINLNTRTK